jgi:hypothetical protein
LAFWLPYLFGFSTGGLFGVWMILRIAELSEKMERRRLVKELKLIRAEHKAR